MTKCFCACHSEPDRSERAFPYAGVDVRDAVAAVLACKSCENAHCPALLVTEPANAPRVVSRGAVKVITPNGKSMSWEDYQVEMQKRADSWKKQADGEGPEA